MTQAEGGPVGPEITQVEAIESDAQGQKGNAMVEALLATQQVLSEMLAGEAESPKIAEAPEKAESPKKGLFAKISEAANYLTPRRVGAATLLASLSLTSVAAAMSPKGSEGSATTFNPTTLNSGSAPGSNYNGASKAFDAPATAPAKANTATTNTSTTPAASTAPKTKSPAAPAKANTQPASTSTSSTSTTAPKAATSPNTLTARTQMLERTKDTTTVAEAVKTMDSTPSTIKQNIQAIFSMPAKKLDHQHGAMNSLLAEFPAGHVGPLNTAEAIAFGAKGSPAFAAMVYNGFHGQPDNLELPQGVTYEQALKSIEADMTAPGTTFRTENPKNVIFDNHGQRGEDTFAAGGVELDGSQKMFVMTNADGNEVVAKLFDNNCINLGGLEMIVQAVTISVPSTPNVPVPVHPNRLVHVAPHKQHHHRAKKVHQQKRTTSTTTTTTTTTTTPPTTTPPTSTPPKINNIKVALPPPGPDHASQSPGTPSSPEPTVPVAGPGPSSTPPETTTTPPAQPTIPENGQPTSTEPAAPVNTGTSTNTPEAPVPPVGGVSSTAPTPTGGVEGQGGSVPSGTTSSTSTVSSN